MTDHDLLMLIADYLDSYELDVYREYDKVSDDVKPLIQARMSVVTEIIDFIEQETGIVVRTTIEVWLLIWADTYFMRWLYEKMFRKSWRQS